MQGIGVVPEVCLGHMQKLASQNEFVTSSRGANKTSRFVRDSFIQCVSPHARSTTRGAAMIELTSFILIAPLLASTASIATSSDVASELVFVVLPNVTSESVTVTVPLRAQSVRLRLRRNNRLLAAGFLVEEQRHLNGSRAERFIESSCYYTGRVSNDRKSFAAVSLCRGLEGVFKTNGNRFRIEPRGEVIGAISGDLHVVYIRQTAASFSDEARNDMATNRTGGGGGGEERRAEIVVVVDDTMVERYGVDRAAAVSLQAMNLAYFLFRRIDETVPFRLVVSRLVIVSSGSPIKESEELTAEQSVTNFCQWTRSRLQRNESDHGGVALLLTRRSVCNEAGTLGAAFAGGACDANRACAVSRDADDFDLGRTIAHELGHTFGMPHDEPAGCRPQVMGEKIPHSFWPTDWSSCSRMAFDEFLRSAGGSCLEKVVVTSSKPTSQIAVCREFYGSLATECNRLGSGDDNDNDNDDDDDVCSSLTCSLDGGVTCTKTSLLAPDGMACNKTSVCVNGHCVPEVWSSWSKYDSCSMSCGRGVQKRRRRCKSIKCSGKSFQYRLCHIQACPPGSDTSRQVTCASYSSHWKPYLHLDPRLQCQVWCVRAREPVKLADRAPDGLACGNDDQHVCVHGKCVRIKCEIDDCGVCGGNGSSCASVSGRFLRRYTRVRFIHRLVVRVPAGASRIRVEEENSSNYLALKSGLHSNFFFNGQAIANSGIYSADGASVIYQRNRDHSETIFIKGPTLRPLDIMVLVQENAVNVSYRYQVDRQSDSISLRHDYVWTYTEWSACPRSCGGGRQTRQLVCKETATGFPVASSLCGASGGGETPTASRECNVQPCEPRWQSGEWTACSASCGVGQRRRVVTCVEDRDARRGGPKKVSKRRCSSERKPKKKTKCEIESCPTGTWVDNGWQPCSVTCGEGKEWKSFVCQSTVTEKAVARSECSSVLLPSAVRGCSMPSCPPRECRDESEYYCRTVLATVGSWICDSSAMSYFSERDCCQSCRATR